MSNKVAIIGTTSSGKTTLAYELLWRLKRAGVHCDGVLQQDRRFSFDRAQLETEREAQYSFIANQVKAESDLALRTRADWLICDRSTVDLYAYYETTYGVNKTWFDFATHWALDYKHIYVCNSLPYVADGVRPSEKFRDRVFEVLATVLSRASLPNITLELNCSREKFVQNILNAAGCVLSQRELDIIPQMLEMDVLIGGSYAFNRASKSSDLDVYIMSDTQHKDYFVGKLYSLLGFKNIEIHYVPNKAVWEYLKSQGFSERKYVEVS